MKDQRFDGLPQPVRDLSNHVVQLERADLNQLFAESIPQAQRLPAASARVAHMMYLSGADAVAIARRIGASPAAVLAFLERLNPPAAQADAPAEPAPSLPQPVHAAAHEMPTPPVMTPLAVFTVEKPTWDPTRDVELTELQQSVIRRLRKLRIPAHAIGMAMRIAPDQILRISKEAP